MPDVPVPRSRRLRLEVLQQFRLVVDGVDACLPEGGQRMLAWLALEDRPRSRSSLAAAMWPDRSDVEAASCLRRALWRLERDAPGAVRRSHDQLQLSADVEVDLHEAVRVADAVQAGEPVTTPRVVRLLEGELLPQWSFDWLDPQRESLRQRRLHALEHLAARHLAEGHPARALVPALAAVAVEPLRESAQRLVVRAHLAEGNTSEALRQFAAYRELLWRELRLRPGRQLVALLPTSPDGAAPADLVGPPAVDARLDARVDVRVGDRVGAARA